MRGRIGLNQQYVNDSIVGSRFSVRVTAPARVGGFDAALPEVSGQARVMGMSQWLLEDSDPFPAGFFLRQAGLRTGGRQHNGVHGTCHNLPRSLGSGDRFTISLPEKRDV